MFAWVFAKTSIVGYQTVEVEAKNYVILAVQFEGVGESSEIAVKDLVSYSNPSGGATLTGVTDQIWRWNVTKKNWDKYFYRSGRIASQSGDVGWCMKGATTNTTDTIKAGESAFFFRGDSTDITIKFSYPTTD